MEYSEKIVTSKDGIYNLLDTIQNTPIIVSIAQPIPATFLELFRQKGFSYRRVGFRKWEISPPFFEHRELRIREDKIVIIARFIVLFFAMVTFKEIIVYLFHLFWQQWLPVEEHMQKLPVLASVLAGSILFIPARKNFEKIRSFMRCFVGLGK
jgi:hypothetical protein